MFLSSCCWSSASYVCVKVYDTFGIFSLKPNHSTIKYSCMHTKSCSNSTSSIPLPYATLFLLSRSFAQKLIHNNFVNFNQHFLSTQHTLLHFYEYIEMWPENDVCVFAFFIYLMFIVVFLSQTYMHAPTLWYGGHFLPLKMKKKKMSKCNKVFSWETQTKIFFLLLLSFFAAVDALDIVHEKKLHKWQIAVNSSSL